MVEKLKEHWLKWLVGGIPTAIVLLGAFWAAAVQAGKIETSLADIQASEPARDQRLNSLEKALHDMQMELQHVEDELRYEQKIDEERPRRKHTSFERERATGW